MAALSDFYEPGPRDYQARVEAYAAAMGKLYQDYPKDTDAGAFYALALLASQAPNDDSLTLNRKAMAVLTPLFAQYPDHPGVVHYIIHACDTPALAQDGLAAAKHYGEIAASAPHAVHMPGHIFARLGMWQADIDANVGFGGRLARRRKQKAKRRHGSVPFGRFLGVRLPAERPRGSAPKRCSTIPPPRLHTSRPCRTWAITI